MPMIMFSYVEFIKILLTNSLNNRSTLITNMIEIKLNVIPSYVANI